MGYFLRPSCRFTTSLPLRKRLKRRFFKVEPVAVCTLGAANFATIFAGADTLGDSRRFSQNRGDFKSRISDVSDTGNFRCFVAAIKIAVSGTGTLGDFRWRGDQNSPRRAHKNGLVYPPHKPNIIRPPDTFPYYFAANVLPD